MTRAIRKDAASYLSAYHQTTSRLERFKAVHEKCVSAVAAALFGRASIRQSSLGKQRGRE